MTVIPAQSDDLVITLRYYADDVGDVVEMWDNHVLGWYFGNAINPNDAWPCIVNYIPEAAVYAPPTEPPVSGEVQSPPWIAIFGQKAVAAYGIWTGSPTAVFTYLATNNAANRRLKSSFVYPELMAAWAQWCVGNPNYIWAPP